MQQQLLDALLLPADEQHPVGSGGVAAARRTRLRWRRLRIVAWRSSCGGAGYRQDTNFVRRIEGLLADGVDPATILVLTFSNKAANELSGRIAA